MCEFNRVYTYDNRKFFIYLFFTFIAYDPILVFIVIFVITNVSKTYVLLQLQIFDFRFVK